MGKLQYRVRRLRVIGILGLLAIMVVACSTVQGGMSPQERQLITQADVAKAQGRSNEALRLYEQAAGYSTGAVRAHVELAALYRQQQRFSEEAEILSRAYRLNPRSQLVLRDYARSLLRQGKETQAAALAIQGLEAYPDDVPLLNLRGILFDRHGLHAEAQRLYARAMERSTSGQEREITANNQILSFIATGQYENALGVAQAMLPLAQDKAALRQMMAFVYGVQGKEDKAYDLLLQDMDVEAASGNLRFYRAWRNGEVDKRQLFAAAG